MTLYAHTVIEEPGPGATRRFNVGDRVPKDLDGIDELIEGGAVSDEEPVREVESGDGASVEESTDD